MVVASNCFASSAWRSFTRCHNSSSTMRSSSTSVLIHFTSGFGRDTRLPVFGSLMKRCRFQTSTPAYSSLLTMPFPRQAWPRIVVSPQVWPNGPGRPSRFRSVAMARGDFPTANSRKMRRTIGASISLILRSPRTVAVAEPAAGLALLHPAAQTTMGLGGEVFQEQGVHCALKTDMQF